MGTVSAQGRLYTATVPKPRIFFFFYITATYLFFYLFNQLICFLGLHVHDVEVPRLGVESKLWLPAYITFTVTQDTKPN